MNKIDKMLTYFRPLLIFAGVLMMLLPSSAHGDNVVQMNLGEMYQRADKVFSGIVIAAIPGSVRAGGGEIPTVTYRIRVDESFKGGFQMVKGTRIAEVRMAAMEQFRSRSLTRMVGLVSEVPRLEVGGRYLLLTTRPSSIGLSAPVGLGQGCFRITGKGGGSAVNAHGNKLLFRGMGALERQNPAGRLSYRHLADIIHGLSRGQRR